MFNAIELVPKKSIVLPASMKADNGTEEGEDFGDLLGGVIKNGELGWIANGAHLDIYLMKNKERIANYTFEMCSNLQPSMISCVTEIFIPDINSPILAVCVQFAENSGMICVFSVQGSRVIRSLEFPDKITSCCFISPIPLKYGGIKIFDGCLAVGTDLGKVFLIDLCLKKYSDFMHDKMSFRNEIELVPVYNILVDEGFENIKSSVKKSRKENCHISVQLQVLQDSGTVLSMLLLSQQMTLVIGLYDGRMILYDLNNLQAFHLAYPPEMECPLMKLSFIEPLDDPRACIYIWALHYNSKISIAVMHSVMFEHKQFDPEGYVYFENFQACSARLTIPLFDEPNNRPINCQSIRNRATYEEEEETSCITIISWESLDRNRINFFIFDLNQWYKDQMPEVLSPNRLPNYLALFAVNVGSFGLDLWIYPKTIIPFTSVQRLEEHFYPNSLSFNCIVLSEKRCDHFHWTGVQNHAINYLNGLGSKGVVDPNVCFGMLTSTAIYPQYWDEIHDSRIELTITVKRNFLLSIALEYNCLRLLKECIKLWGDGSHLGDGNNIGVSLSTITDWISQRFGQIKIYCKSLCQSFFNNIEQQIDYRLKKQLSYSSKQLKTLEKLLEMILTVNRMYIPEEIRNRLGNERDTIKMWYEYYEIILWLSNTDILPEGATVPYPYDILNDYYKTQRYTFRKLDHSTRNYLFIDVFLEIKCNPKELRKLWKSTEGEYPPISLEEMLNILILPNTSNEIKYIMILYFFMDLAVALEEDRFCNVIENLIKFPSVFKLNSSIIKRIQAYWKLDHGQHETALDYLFSPLSGEKSFETWETEFLIETLLLQSLPKLALRVLQLNNPSINSLLEIKTLLANNLISDAFKIQRNKNDINLLNYFYKFLFNNCKWELLLDYALNDTEIKVLSSFLNNINSNQSENFHIIFLLQRAKYIDAIKLLNKIKKLNSSTNLNMNNTNLILTAYNMTLTPAIKNLTKSYFNFESEYKLHKEMNGTTESPFSKQLIENPVNSSFNLHKIVFNSIKHCRNGGPDRAQSERIPFLENPYISRSANDSQTSNHTATIVPKVINSADYGKRRSDPELQESVEFIQPKKKVMTDTDFKIKTLKDFKQTRKYDFSQSYSKLMENKRNKMTISDYTFLSKLSSVDTPSTVDESEVENTIIAPRVVFKTTDDEFFSPEKPKITAEEWNSQIDMSMEIDDLDRSEEPIRQKEIEVIINTTDPLVPEEKITPEMWNESINRTPIGNLDEMPQKTIDRQLKRTAEIKTIPEIENPKIVNLPIKSIDPPVIQIPEVKITPEMWNQGIVPDTVEKSGAISRKAYDRPSKRRALRSMSKTPERSFRRSRTKTPELLTPSRKSKRLLEKIPTVIPEPVLEEKPEAKSIEIPAIVIEDYSSSNITKTVEFHHIMESSTVSEIISEPKRQTVLDDTEKSEFQIQDEDSKQVSSSDSSEIVPIKRAPVLKDSDVSQIIEDSSNESDDLEITYHKENLFTDSFVDDEIVFDDEEVGDFSPSSPSVSDYGESVDIEVDDGPEINYEDDIEEVSEEEEIDYEPDYPDRYEVINIISSSSSSNNSLEETSNDLEIGNDLNRDYNEAEEQYVGDNKTDDEKIIFESQELPTEPQITVDVSNIIYGDMEIDVRINDTMEDVDINNAVLFESESPEISVQIQEVETTPIVESKEPMNASMVITVPDELEHTDLNITENALNDAVIITEVDTIIDDKTEVEPNITTTIPTIVIDESLLNQGMIMDDTVGGKSRSSTIIEPETNVTTAIIDDAVNENTKSTTIVEPETVDLSELKQSENTTSVVKRSFAGIGDKAEVETTAPTTGPITCEDSALLNQAMIVDETIIDAKSTFVAESEDNAMTGDISELRPSETSTADESTIVDVKDDSNTLNEALIMVDEDVTDIIDAEQMQVIKAPETSSKKSIDTETDKRGSPYLFRKTRAASVEPETSTSKRSVRGSSVPKSVMPLDGDRIKSPMLRKRRSFSTDSHTPKKSIHITKADMEIILESQTLPSTVNTPIKAILADKLRNTPTRRRSVTVEQTETPTTPARITRRSSINIEAEGTPIKLEEMVTPTRSRKRSNSIDNESVSSKVSETGSTKLARKTNKTSTPDSETHESPMDQSESVDYTSNRRLTRHQLAVMEKMEEKRIGVPIIPLVSESDTNIAMPTGKSSKRTRSTKSQKENDSANNSDNESIASTGSSITSKASSLRSRGSRTSQSNKTSNKGKKEKKTPELSVTPDKPLPTIDEDSENEDSASGSGRRLRVRSQVKK